MSLKEEIDKLDRLYFVMKEVEIGVTLGIPEDGEIGVVTDIGDCSNLYSGELVCKRCKGTIGINGREPDCMVSKDGNPLFYVMTTEHFKKEDFNI